MKKFPKTIGNPRKLGGDLTPGPSGFLKFRIARADRELLATATRLRGSTESEYVRTAALAAAKRDIAASLRTK